MREKLNDRDEVQNRGSCVSTNRGKRKEQKVEGKPVTILEEKVADKYP